MTPWPAGSRAEREPAPAKLNLGLRVLGRRPDGYHEIESLFVPLDLCDELEVVAREGDPGVHLEVSGATSGVPTDARNLAVGAAERFLAAANLERAVEIRLEKRIPAAAGLGGGSSDAGAVLRALSRAFPTALAPPSLAELALGLGADVPFFLSPRPAWVAGIGERIEPAEGVPSFALLLANPGIPLATAEVYAAWDVLAAALTPPPPPSNVGRRSAFPDDPGRVDPARLEPLVANDLAAAARRLCPEIGILEERMRRIGALAVGVSGSGPTVFGMFRDAAAAERARSEAGFAPAIWTRVARTLSSGEAGAWSTSDSAREAPAGSWWGVAKR